MSAIHRVDEIREMPARKFFPMAWRLPAYRGVMRERALASQRAAEPQEQARPPSARQPAYAPTAYPQRERRLVPATKTALSHDPAFAGIFSFGGSGT